MPAPTHTSSAGGAKWDRTVGATDCATGSGLGAAASCRSAIPPKACSSLFAIGGGSTPVHVGVRVTKPLPPMRGIAPPLSCTRIGCGHDATHHIIWTADIDNGLVCDDHLVEAKERWSFVAVHPYQLDCSSDHALFVWAENRCVTDLSRRQDARTYQTRTRHHQVGR